MHRSISSNKVHQSVGAIILRTFIFSVFLGGSVVSTGFLTPASAQAFSFSDVVVEGNDRVDAASIVRFAGIGRGVAVSAGALNEAYQRIVQSGLFETVELVPQGSTLLIRVQEYPIVNIINFEGNRRLEDEELSALIGSESRRVYSPAQAEADAAAITEAYRIEGRIAATVEPKIIRRTENRVDLVFEVTEGRVVEIERLSFVGNRAFSDRRLRQVLETKQAGLLRTFVRRDTFVAERLDLDKQLLRDFYLSRGYADVQILDATGEVTRERDGFFVTFTIQEGQQFRIGQISAVSEVEGLDVAEFQAALRIRPGATYSPSIIENNVARLEALALQKGLTFVAIEPRITRNERARTLDVAFALVRGERIFVERIDIEGNTTTLDQVVRRQFNTVEGDPFNPREIRQSAERIRALGFFADARVEAEPGSTPDQVVVNVDVEEQPTGSLTFGVSYGAVSGVAFTVGLTESNFLGRGQFLGVNISTGTDNLNSSISFAEPAFLGRDLRFKFNAFYNTTDNDDSEYSTQRIGVSPAIEFPISQNGRLELRYTVKQDEVFSVDRGAVDDPDTPDVDETSNGSSRILVAEEQQGAPISSSVGFTYSYDTRITGLNPNGGVLLRFGTDLAGLGGDIQSVTTTGLALAETKIWNEEVTVRAIFEGGAVHMLEGDSRVTDRFFGNGKIRGFEGNGLGPRDLGATNEDALGGNLFAVARFEADFPLGLPEEYGITGGLFMDVGSVWSLDNVNGTGGPVDDSLILRSTVGFSIFWETPIGPLRLNFSKALMKEDYDREQSFDLTVSTTF
jgi:outer membrane protein insertion porin family